MNQIDFLLASAGNYDLEKALRLLAASMGIATPGNIYYVLTSTEPNYVELFKNQKVYADGSAMIQPTIAAAYAETLTNRNDVIFLSANGTSNKVTAMLTVANNRVHFIGLDPVGRKIGARSLISNTGAGVATDVSMVKVTGTGCSFRNIKFSNNWTVTENLSAMLDYGANTYFENCDFENLGSAHLTNNAAASLILAGAESIYKNCTLGEDTLLITSTGGQAVLIKKGTSARAATRCVFENCIFQTYTSDTTHVFVRVNAAGDVDRYVSFDDCKFMNTGAGATSGVSLAVVAATPGSMAGGLFFNRPAVFRADNLATVGVGNTGVFVVSPVLAAAASDCVAVQAS